MASVRQRKGWRGGSWGPLVHGQTDNIMAAWTVDWEFVKMYLASLALAWDFGPFGRL